MNYLKHIALLVLLLIIVGCSSADRPDTTDTDNPSIEEKVENTVKDTTETGASSGGESDEETTIEDQPAPKPAPKEGTPVNFQTVDQGAYSSKFSSARFAVHNEDDWKLLWKSAFKNKQGTTAPILDFSKYTLIAVFQGEKNTGGYAIEIVDIQESDILTIKVKEAVPAPGAIVTQAITSPYHIVSIPASEKVVVFVNV